MSDASVPPELGLEDDDVIEAFEVVPDEAEVEAAPGVTRVSGFDGVGTRREGRERALALLFEAEQRELNPLSAILDGLPLAPDAFTRDLIVGVGSHQSELDDQIERLATGWTLERMPAIDRALLRIGAFELTWTDVPVGACISEAVELAKRYSTDDSHRFINGMLGAVAREVRDDQPE
ncbi:MAG: transcription antitermination factor NusB [Microthrixaceae bacterium]|nr:transcription antitermination factor NusB [Microthrixaceae bacterium]